jgi:tetratricopeptide (TPR) repeat protein
VKTRNFVSRSCSHLPLLGFTLLLVSAAPFAWCNDIQALLSAGKADQGITVLNVRLRANAEDAEAHNLLCRIYFTEERWDDAVSECVRAASLNPKSSTYQLWLGRAYGRKAEHSSFWTAASLGGKARDAFQRAVQLDPSNVEARSDLSEFYIEAPGFMGGGSDKAEAQAEILSRLDPTAAHSLRARIAEHRKQMELAEKEYKQASQLSSDPAVQLIDLANFYRRTGRINEMEEAVTRAAAASTKNGVELFDGGSLLLRTGKNFPTAIDLLRKYLGSSNKGEFGPAFQAEYRLGVLLEKSGDGAQAIAAYRRALDLASEYAPAKNALDRMQSARR